MLCFSRLVGFAGFCVMVALPSVGCERIVRGILGKAEESAGISDDGKGTFKFNDPRNPGTTLSIGAKEAPADFPKSIPLYPGSTIIAGSSMGDQETQVSVVGLQTKDSPDQVAAFYKSKFAASGYQDTSDIPNNPMGAIARLVTFDDAVSGRKATITIQSLGPNGTSIQIAAGGKAK